MKSALGYLRIAEEANGPIRPLPVSDDYIWGDALQELRRAEPDARIINLETSVTQNDSPWPGKGIQYRMHPRNVGCLTAAQIDCCTLANNHVLDWRVEGLLETLRTLSDAGIASCGAGHNITQAQRPAIIDIGRREHRQNVEISVSASSSSSTPSTGGRIVVFSMGSRTSGVPPSWAATADSPGVFFVDLNSGRDVSTVAERVRQVKQTGDIVVASIHMGSNWGYHVPSERRWFCHQLVDRAGVDVVHGHSSHHPKGIEVYKGKPILYGCGDFFNDYEGISGYEEFRGNLSLMYFVTMNTRTGNLDRLRMVPMLIRNFKLNHVDSRDDAQWICDMLTREGKEFETSAEVTEEGIELIWMK